ncbi:hypothetical protein, partial [Mycobacterium sp.]|uniref:hypothetical protein n=1 Tax=Mycobacterium sp. TaxID=1785 RepID=UPI002621F6AD
MTAGLGALRDDQVDARGGDELGDLGELLRRAGAGLPTLDYGAEETPAEVYPRLQAAQRQAP